MFIWGYQTGHSTSLLRRRILFPQGKNNAQICQEKAMPGRNFKPLGWQFLLLKI
jgi:hypothetical protein